MSSPSGEHYSGTESQEPDARQYAFLFTDLVDSTGLKSQLNAWKYVRHVLDPHDAMFRKLLAEFPQAHEIKQLGDGFLAIFSDVRDAVCFALRFHQALQQYDWELESPDQQVITRIGIDVGFAVAKWDEGVPVDVFGPNVDVASRVMNAADGGRTLLTSTAFDIARQAVAFVELNLRRAGISPSNVELTRHGEYRIQGVEQPVVLCEATLPGVEPRSPRSRPPKVINIADQDWRPESPAGVLNSSAIPDRPGWKLVRKLGEGSFGSAFLGEDTSDTGNRRVFKFCQTLEQVEALRNELDLLRRTKLLRRIDIVEYYGAHLERPPFFLELEYVEGGNLLDWSDGLGGLHQVPFAQRMDLFLKVAHAVAAAHREGIFHLDLMPSNILMDRDADGGWRPKLADFGMGTSESTDARKRPPSSPISGSGSAVRSARHLYSAPECGDEPDSTGLSGAAALHVRDVYSLGVLLFQLAVGDLQRPLSPSAIRVITPKLLREDIEDATHYDPRKRMRSAAELESRIRNLPRRARRRFLLSSFIPAVVMLFTTLVFVSTLLLVYVDLYDDAADAHAAAERYNREKLLAIGGFWHESELLDAPSLAGDVNSGTWQLQFQKELRRWMLEESQRDLAALRADSSRLDDRLAFARLSLRISQLLEEQDLDARERHLQEGREVLARLPQKSINADIQLLISDFENGLGQVAVERDQGPLALEHFEACLSTRRGLLRECQAPEANCRHPVFEYERKVLETLHHLGTARWTLGHRDQVSSAGVRQQQLQQADIELQESLDGRRRLVDEASTIGPGVVRDLGSSLYTLGGRKREQASEAQMAGDASRAGELLVDTRRYLMEALQQFRTCQDLEAERGAANAVTGRRMVDTLRDLVDLELDTGNLEAAASYQQEMAAQVTKVLPKLVRDLNGLIYLTAAKVELKKFQDGRRAEDLQAAKDGLRLAEHVYLMLTHMEDDASEHWGDLGTIQVDLGLLLMESGAGDDEAAARALLHSGLAAWDKVRGQDPRRFELEFADRYRELRDR